MSKHAWFLEVIQDRDGTYSAKMIMGGKPVEGLASGVDYNTLRESILRRTGVVILSRNKMFFQQSGHRKFAFIDATQEREDCRVTLEEIKNGWKPKFDLDFETAEGPTAVDDLLHSDKSFRYQLLDRLRSDCDYYLGYGNRRSQLWAGSVKEQIACMKALWNSFPANEKPDFISMEKIYNYEKEMVSPKQSLSDKIQSASSRASGTDSPNVKSKTNDLER